MKRTLTRRATRTLSLTAAAALAVAGLLAPTAGAYSRAGLPVEVLQLSLIHISEPTRPY